MKFLFQYFLERQLIYLNNFHDLCNLYIKDYIRDWKRNKFNVCKIDFEI